MSFNWVMLSSLRSSPTGIPPLVWHRIARICGSLNLVVFISSSSGILLKKFYVRIPMIWGGLPAASASMRWGLETRVGTLSYMRRVP